MYDVSGVAPLDTRPRTRRVCDFLGDGSAFQSILQQAQHLVGMRFGGATLAVLPLPPGLLAAAPLAADAAPPAADAVGAAVLAELPERGSNRRTVTSTSFLARFPRSLSPFPYFPARAVGWALFGNHGPLVLIGAACNPMLCPIWGFRHVAQVGGIFQLDVTHIQAGAGTNRWTLDVKHGAGAVYAGAATGGASPDTTVDAVGGHTPAVARPRD